MGNQCCDGREEAVQQQYAFNDYQERQRKFDEFDNINTQNKMYNEDSLHGINNDNLLNFQDNNQQNSFNKPSQHNIFGDTQFRTNSKNNQNINIAEMFPSEVKNNQQELSRKDSPFSGFQSNYNQKIDYQESDKHIINAESFRKKNDVDDYQKQQIGNKNTKTSNIFLQDDDLNQLQQITQSQFQQNNYANSKFENTDEPEMDYNTQRGQIRMSNFEQLPNDSITYNHQDNSLQKIDESLESKYKDDGIKSYEGQRLNGKPHGKGKIIFNNGNIYEGELYSGQLQGYGKLEKPSEYIYEGYFMEDQFNGKGKKIYQDGRIYEGEFRNGKEQGVGMLTGPDQKIISRGIWINGILQGQNNQVKL